MKHTAEGGRRGIQVTRGRGDAVIALADTGLGIPHHRHDVVFRRV